MTPQQENKIFPLQQEPGIQRDGTVYGSRAWTDGQWVRFQRGLPKKIGGYKRITAAIQGPVREVLVWSRANLNALYTFSSSKAEVVLVDENMLGAGINDVTPSGFTPDEMHLWSVDTQYDDAVGSQGTIVLAHASHSLHNIDDTTASKPFFALANGTSQFAEITGATAVSGGVFSVAPYTILYGSDGFIQWSDVNQPQVYNAGDAGADRITGAKIVKGLPLRAGGGIAALLWSLDSVLRMDYIGGNAIWRFSTMSSQSSILSQNSVIEYDGIYYWIGLDRFMYFDSAVRELPNDKNQNWFFDNLNYAERQKVFAVKMPRWGEIWWFYPRGDATECSHAVIFNVREKTWYDVTLQRTGGFYSQATKYPVLLNNYTSTVIQLPALTNFNVGDTVTGGTSAASGTIISIDATYSTITLDPVSGVFQNPELIVSSSGGSQTSSFVDTYSTGEIYQHEVGINKSEADFEVAIPAYVTTGDLGVITAGMDRWTRFTRMEPDFNQEGDMTMTVIGQEFPNSPDVSETQYNFTGETDKVDVREQHRHLRLKFETNSVGGDFEMGKVMLHLEPGDARS